MCGRYALYTDIYEWSQFAVPWPFEDGFNWTASYNIAPSHFAPVVLNLASPVIARYRWGLVPSWSKDPAIGNRMINARAESVAEKAAFREPFRKRRCVVLADGFFEWKKSGRKKTPVYFGAKNRELLGFAGLWDHYQPLTGEHLRTFTIITTQPNELVEPIHNRMPVILAPENYSQWLAASPPDPSSLRALLRPCPTERLEFHLVSQYVNNPMNNSAECVQPVRAL